MNAILKNRLQLFFLGNKLKVGNGRRGFAGLALVNRRHKSLFDKTCLNILRVENVRRFRAGLTIEQDNRVNTGRDDEVDIREDNKASIRGREDQGGRGGQNNKVDIGK